VKGVACTATPALAPPLDTCPSPKTAYRSPYVYLGGDNLEQPATWEPLSEFGRKKCRDGRAWDKIRWIS